MVEHQEVKRPHSAVSVPARQQADAFPSLAPLLRLQHQAGNAAVSRLLQRRLSTLLIQRNGFQAVDQTEEALQKVAAALADWAEYIEKAEAEIQKSDARAEELYVARQRIGSIRGALGNPKAVVGRVRAVQQDGVVQAVALYGAGLGELYISDIVTNPRNIYPMSGAKSVRGAGTALIKLATEDSTKTHTGGLRLAPSTEKNKKFYGDLGFVKIEGSNQWVLPPGQFKVKNQ